MYQNMDAQGVFYDMPYGTEGTELRRHRRTERRPAPAALSVNLFKPSYDKDRFENTALTVNGRVGPLKPGVLRLLPRPQHPVTVRLHQLCARPVRLLLPVHRGLYSSTAGNANATCYSPGMVWSETVRNTNLSRSCA